jgi:RHS repeat-associated protein
MKRQMKPMVRLVTLLILVFLPHLASAYYDPGVQRWINRDPVGEPGFEAVRGQGQAEPAADQNQYVFVGNNPVASADPLGLEYGTGFAAYQQCINDCEGIRLPCKLAAGLEGFVLGIIGPGPSKALTGACGLAIKTKMDEVCDKAVAACKQACEKKTKYTPPEKRPRSPPTK